MSGLKYYFILVALICTAVSSLLAQSTGPRSKPRQLTVADSVLVNKYIDSVNVSTLFSQKRQRYYDSALAICPWKANWWQQKAMPLFKQRKYEAGMVYLDSAVKYDPASYIDYRAFIKCIFQKSYWDAINDFRTAKDIVGASEVMDHTYDFYIGLCYLELNRFDSSEYYLTRTIDEQRKTRGDSWVHYLDLFYLGIVYYEKEDYPKAIGFFDRSLDGYKNFSDALYYKAVCFRKLHKDDEALALIKEAETDFKQGYTINEDNTDYEPYPYQVNKQRTYTVMVNAFASAGK